jgi:hypothetical protein
MAYLTRSGVPIQDKELPKTAVFVSPFAPFFGVTLFKRSQVQRVLILWMGVLCRLGCAMKEFDGRVCE